MELKCLEDYTDTICIMKMGDTTTSMDISEEHKEKMLSDYPYKFEVVKQLKKVSELVVENKEANLSITKKATKK